MRSTELREQIGARVRKRRLVLGLSQRDIAEPGLTGTYLSRIERGERLPSVWVLRRLASKLDVSVYWLETGKIDPAERLAKLVLQNEGQVLPSQQASRLARQVLHELGAARDFEAPTAVTRGVLS